MLIHRAETGASISHPAPLHTALLAPDLWPALADLAGIRPQALRVFLPSGEPIRADAVDDAREMEELARKVEQAGEEEVFAFDLDAIAGTEGDGRERDLLIDPPEEPEISVLPAYALTTSKPSTFLPSAQIHHAHISSLLTAQQIQHRALALAYSTLSSHISNLSSALAAFSPLAARELARQATLLRDHKLSMVIMSRVRVHPEVRRMREGKWQKGKETLGDLIRGDAMRMVEEGCRTWHADLVARWNRVIESRDALVDGADRVRVASELLEPREAEECYHRTTRSLTTLQELVSDNSDDEPQTEEEDLQLSQVMSELRTLDRSIRTELHTMTSLKNKSTLSLLSALRTISQLQSSISHLPPVLKQLESQLRSSASTIAGRPSIGLSSGGAHGVANFAHVERVRRGLLVYGATIVEVVRRKEFARFFSSRARALSELMSKLTTREHKRRQTFRSECSGQLPFEVRGLGPEQPVPSVEITTMGSEVGEWGLERSDVAALMDLVRELERLPYPPDDSSVYYDRKLAQSGEKPKAHPATEARLALEKMVEKMDALEEGFDRMAERSLLSVSWGGQSRQRTTSDVSGYRDALDELRELKRAKSEANERSNVEQDALQAEVTRLRADLARAKEQCEEANARTERLDSELRSVRAMADSDRSVRQTLERRHNELRSDLAHKGQQLEQALAEGTAQTEEMEALRKELLHAREEFERVRALQEESASEAGKLLRAQAEMLRELEEARKRGEDLEKGIEDAWKEGQKASEALAEADREKERLLRLQASEADRRLRDQRAEADGDRAVLERHYYELTAQVGELETELKEVRGAGEVMLADLEEATERLSRAGEEEGVWEEERRVAREENERLEREHQELRDRATEREFLLADLITVAATFRDTSARLFASVQASNVVTKMVNGEIVNGTPPKPALQQPQQQSKPIDPSDPVTALQVLREFDLAGFSDAVLKTGSTIRRWQKNTREYRERAKGRISYRNFAKGDLALFLPTRNNVAKPWAAFNVGFPHYFLQQTPTLTETLNGRDWLVARITAIREMIADSQDPTSNPYSLIDGLKFHMLDVELVNLTAPDPSSRRSKNSHSPKSFDGNASVTADSMMASIVTLSSPTKPAVPENAIGPSIPSASTRPARPPVGSLLTRALPQPFPPISTPIIAQQQAIPSPFSPVISSPDAATNTDTPTSPTAPQSATTETPSSPTNIPFATPQLAVPSSTQHTLLEEADIIRPPSALSHTKSARSTPSRGSFSSSRGRPSLLSGASAVSASNKSAPTTALMRTATPSDPPQTPSPADSLGAGLDSVRRNTPSQSPVRTSAPSNPFAAIASNLGATFGRKRTASVATLTQGLANQPERRDSPNSAADLLKRFQGS